MTATGETLPNSSTEKGESQAPSPEVQKPAETVAPKPAEDPRLKEVNARLNALGSTVDQQTADRIVATVQTQVEAGKTPVVTPELTSSVSSSSKSESADGESPLMQALKDLFESIASIFKTDEEEEEGAQSKKSKRSKESNEKWPNEEYVPLDKDAPVWSIPEGVVSTLTSIKGPRNAPKTNQGHGSTDHKGNDIAMPEKTPILLTADSAVVKYVRTQPEGAGHYIALELEDGSEAYFMHFYKEPSWKPGDKLKRGDVIGLSGNSGNSSGPHLHFEIRQNGVAVDPQAYLQEPYHNEHEDERRVA